MSRVRELLFSVHWFSFHVEWHGGQGTEMGFIGLGHVARVLWCCLEPGQMRQHITRCTLLMNLCYPSSTDHMYIAVYENVL